MPFVNFLYEILLTGDTISTILSAPLHEVGFAQNAKYFEEGANEAEAPRLSEEAKGVKTVLGNETSHLSGAGAS